eukprot:GFKZ01000082.1.p6 GENE.GFKZ01000082.1~~GFKZ01000082.1.p6  ORF type:complete len:106 (+),score=21.25 GFKZ01000082.1:2501-2818(+)
MAEREERRMAGSMRDGREVSAAVVRWRGGNRVMRGHAEAAPGGEADGGDASGGRRGLKERTWKGFGERPCGGRKAAEDISRAWEAEPIQVMQENGRRNEQNGWFW